SSSTGLPATAEVTLELGQGQGPAMRREHGDGPLDAAFNAIEKLTGLKPEVENFSVIAATRGRDAMAEAMIELSMAESTVVGAGASTVPPSHGKATSWMGTCTALRWWWAAGHWWRPRTTPCTRSTPPAAACSGAATWERRSTPVHCLAAISRLYRGSPPHPSPTPRRVLSTRRLSWRPGTTSSSPSR